MSAHVQPASRFLTAATNHSHVYQAVLHWARITPQVPAVNDSGRSLDYATLVDAMSEIADVLCQRGVGAGDRVLIVAENNVAAVAALFAAQALNAWPAIVNARLPAPEISDGKPNS